MPAAERRVRIVVPRYGADVVGGAESLMRQLAVQLAGRGHDVDVVTTCAVDARTWRNEIAPGASTEDGVTVHRHPVARPRRPRLFHEASRVFWKVPARLRPEAWWLRAQGPHAPALLTALRDDERAPTLFCPYLYEPAQLGIHAVRGPRILVPAAHDELPLRLRATARTVAAADALWYSTPEERALVERVHPVAARTPHIEGTAGVTPPETVEPRRFRERHGVAGPYILYGGRTVPGKGSEELLDAARRLHAERRDVSLVLTGEAGVRTAAEPGIVPAGMLDVQTRWDAIAGATAVVVPGLHESLSLLALEAWAVRRPAILNLRSPVLAGHIERGGGGLGYHDGDGLVAAVRRLLDHEGLAVSLGVAGHAYVEREYRWDAVIARFEELLETLASRTSTAA